MPDALDEKLGAFFESEMAATAAQEAAPSVEEPDETPETEDSAAPDVQEAVPAAETPPPADETDPEVAALLAKYGGDPAKALKGAVEAQKLLGRQGSELGDLRRDFEQRIADVQQQAQQAQQQQHVAQQAPGAIETLLEQGNYQAAADYAREASNPTLYRHVMSQWAADPEHAFGATVYHSALERQASDYRIQQEREQLQQEFDQRLASLQPLFDGKKMQDFAQDFAAFQQNRGITREELDVVSPEMLRVAEEYTSAVGPMLQDPDPAEREKALDLLYTIARARNSDTLANAASQAETAAQEAARAAKTAATVGSTTTASQAKPQTDLEEARAEFRKILFDNPSSIQKGLTRE